MLKIYLARHGQDQDNANGILNGHRDEPLTPLGIQQANEIASKIRDAGIVFDAVYASPLQRVFKTAEIICETVEIAVPEVLDLLLERDFGVMTGRPYKQAIIECASDILRTDTVTYILSPQGAEMFPQLVERGKRIINFVMDKHNEGNILLVSHGDIGKMIYAAYYDLDWKDVLRQFHFGNSELLLLSQDYKAEDAHVFTIKQHNL